MPRIFFISDTHINDEEIIAFENWPFSNSAEFLKYIIKNWNRIISPEDEVYHLGDFSLNFSKEENQKLLSQLNGHKYIIMGNHDKCFSIKEWYEIGFEKVYDCPIILDNFFILSHEPLYMSTNMPYVNLFGHVHGNPTYNNVSEVGFCVCMERIDWLPIEFEKIKEAIMKKRIKK